VSLLAAGSPGLALHAALCQLAGAAGTDLLALPDNAVDRIHDVRVGMKKFRALLRLAEPVLTSRRFAHLDALAKTIKDAFGAERDLAVGLDLLRQLLGRRQAEANAAQWESVLAPPIVAAPAPALRAASKLHALLDDLDLADLAPDKILDVWIASYRAGRRALSVCQTARNDDFLFHEWRKRVKQLLYQSAVLGPPVDPISKGAQQLSTTLGLLHDLAVLHQNIPVYDEEVELVILAKKRKTTREALRLGGKVFRDKPGEVREGLRIHD